MFRCPVDFDADETELHFDPALAARPTFGEGKLFKPILTQHIRHRLKQIQVYDAAFSTTVNAAIASLLGSGQCTIARISAGLGLDSRTLHRRLAREDITFSEILQHVREGQVRNLLIHSDASIERISGLLDYSSTPAFTLAFKRWTGASPLAFRRSERARLALDT